MVTGSIAPFSMNFPELGFAGLVIAVIVLGFLCSVGLRRRQQRRQAIARIRRVIAHRQALEEKAKGLQRTMKDAIPSFQFNGGISVCEGDSQCIVCLIEYEQNDCLKQPVCKHIFHADCLDSWLDSHTTCPVCRTSLSLHTETDQIDAPSVTETSGTEFREMDAMLPSPAGEDIEMGSGTESTIHYPSGQIPDGVEGTSHI